MADAILTINGGSSSLKFAIFAGQDVRRIITGDIEGIGTAPRLRIADTKGNVLLEQNWPTDCRPPDSIAALLDWIDVHLGADRLVAVSHRIVHGGRDFRGPVLLDSTAILALTALSPLAPLHQKDNLNTVRAITALRPGLIQIGCFDTAFHHAMPKVATRFALPRALEDEGVRRYGFHGLSYEYIAGKMREIAPTCRKIIVAHLGNGASLCAMKDGKSVDTTMGFTALDGLVMGTRCGALDPGVILYLMQTHGLDAVAVEDLLYRQSGLLGVSGISSDMRVLLANPEPRAREAVDLFIFQAVRQIGALAATLQGLDALVFTAGMGENAPEIRKRICADAAWYGICMDPAANEKGALTISGPNSPVSVFVIPTDEELMLAHHAFDLLQGS